jgi:hypothetical protein
MGPSRPSRDHIETTFDKFERTLHSAKKRLPTTRRYNLSLPQRSVLQELRARPDLIIYPTDKNLGAYIMECPKYIQAMLSEHLSNTDNYEQIKNDQVHSELERQQQRFLEIYQKHPIASLVRQREYISNVLPTPTSSEQPKCPNSTASAKCIRRKQP